MTDFVDRTVLITGGGSGIGLATARLLLAGGASVVLAGRDRERLSNAVKELGAGHDTDEKVLAVPADVSRVADLDHLVAEVGERFGVLHGVFANAGVARFNRGGDVTEAEFDQLVGTNFKGAFFTVQKTVPLLADGGSVVLNASWLAHRGMGFTPVYGAAKAAVAHLARALAADLAPRGIRINAISPGFVLTDLFTGIASSPEEQEWARSQVTLGRLAQPADIAGVVRFLLSPHAAYVTGQDLSVDGGLCNTIPLPPA